MQVTAVAYLLAIVGIVLIGLGIYGVAKGRFAEETSGSGPWITFTVPLSALVIFMGIASLAVSGYFALNSSKNSISEQGKPIATAGPTNKSPTPVPTGHSGAVGVTHPAFGAKVGACGVFSGTSDLPPSETLVLGARNLSDPTKTLFLAPVNNWGNPDDLSEWTGFQYFGSGNGSVGQTYEISVIVIKTDVVRTARSQPANYPTWAVKSLPSSAKVKKILRVVRKKGLGPAVCR